MEELKLTEEEKKRIKNLNEEANEELKNGKGE